MAQTADGILWIGSSNGLYTFDGLSFTRFQPLSGSAPLPNSPAHFLLVSHSGDLWTFGFHGPPARIRNDRVTVFDKTDGPGIGVMSFPQQDTRGGIWAVLNERQVVRLGDDGIWHRVEDPAGGHGHITTMFIDSLDTIWMVENDHLYRSTSARRGFEQTPQYVYGPSRISEGPDHDLWITSIGSQTSSAPPRFLQHLDPDGRSLWVPTVSEKFKGVLPATDGSLWLLSTDNVLIHLSKEQRSSRSSRPVRVDQNRLQLTFGAEGSGDHAFLIGTDKSIWIGGMGGVEHVAKATFVPALAHAPVGDWSSCIDPHGDVWIASPSGALLHKRNSEFVAETGLQHVEALFCSPEEKLALTDDKGIVVLDQNRFRRLPLLPGLNGYSNHYIFTGVAVTSDSTVIAAAAGGAIGHSLWEYTAGRWKRIDLPKDLPEATALRAAADGQIFLGFRGSDPLLINKGIISKLPIEAPGVGNIIGFTKTTYGTFVYGSTGIAIRVDHTFRVIRFAKPELCSVVTGLAEARNGDLWINGAEGIVRIPAAEIRENLRNVTYPVASTNLREGDLVGPAFPGAFSRSAQTDPDGRIWFSTLNGVVSVDPERIPPSKPPSLSIRSIRADGLPLNSSGAFPPDIQTLSINYIGVDLTHPREVSYRYQLQGLDKGWQDAGSRTQAIYTHLGPGHYQFMVMASNSYGSWTKAVLSVPFTVAPHFYETPWFELLCVSVAVLLLVVILRARLALITAGIMSRAEERADERISIARDLHDTLLQGVQGLLLTFHAAAERVPDTHESKQALERALLIADKVILEGRNRVKGLRALDFVDGDLRSSIETLGEELNGFGQVAYSVNSSEPERALQKHVRNEVFLIARECITNAFRHANATRISIDLEYGNRLFCLTCTDNGSGFNAGTLKASERNGHWGMKGMTERAKKLGAKFDYRSAPGMGTVVRLALKAKRAYE